MKLKLIIRIDIFRLRFGCTSIRFSSAPSCGGFIASLTRNLLMVAAPHLTVEVNVEIKIVSKQKRLYPFILLKIKVVSIVHKM
jgi:hypothetical protein